MTVPNAFDRIWDGHLLYRGEIYFFSHFFKYCPV